LIFLFLLQYLPFRELFEKYAELTGKQMNKLTFYFDGEVLSPETTPVDVDMDDDDTIDVAEKK
jgi:hypothetical protein